MKITANAKINLSLDVIRKRPDNYHDVKMIMQTLEFGDTVEIEKTSKKISLCGTGNSVCYDENNLAYRAARIFFENTKIIGGADIYIEKKIPVCAGLAGGSSDAAAVLTALNTLYGNPLDENELMNLGAGLGADVPYCIKKGTAVAEGIGEIITPIAPFPEKAILIVKPEADIPTPWAYKNLELSTVTHPDINAAVAFIQSGNLNALYKNMGNVFESVAFRRFPIIKSIKEDMLSLGADAALMSGSGPTVFGIFENKNFAENAYNIFKNKFKETFLTKSFNV